MIVVLVTTAGLNETGGLFLIFFPYTCFFFVRIGFFMYFCNHEKTYPYFDGGIAHHGFLRL